MNQNHPRAAIATSWQEELRNAYRDPDSLLRDLGVDPDAVSVCRPAKNFPLLAPRPYVQRMNRCDPRDPLLLQVLPIEAEAQSAIGFTNDPVGELAKIESSRLLRSTKAAHC